MGENPWKFRPRQTQLFLCPQEIDLTVASGQILFVPVGHMSQVWGNKNSAVGAIITKWILLYTEACDGEGVSANLRLGYNGNDVGHGSYINQVQSLGDVIEINQSSLAESRSYIANDFISVRCMGGGAQTTGKVRMSVELSFDYTDWVNFAP